MIKIQHKSYVNTYRIKKVHLPTKKGRVPSCLMYFYYKSSNNDRKDNAPVIHGIDLPCGFIKTRFSDEIQFSLRIHLFQMKFCLT